MFTSNGADNRKRAVALGNFDGLHKGHIAVIKSAKEYADCGMIPSVLLFLQHSMALLGGKTPPMLLETSERDKRLKELGLEIVIIDFNEIKDMLPGEFVKEFLIKRLNVGAVVCGYNYKFGKNAMGDASDLQRLCKDNNIICSVAQEIDVDSIPVSSSNIRACIESGETEKANNMLGYKFGFTGDVIHGDARGRTLGFPTINQIIPKGLVLPRFGVYESEVIVKGKTYSGITNIGKRPTVGTQQTLSETHIINFNENLYGQSVEIRLVRFIRDERKFGSLEELANQIQSDIDFVG